MLITRTSPGCSRAGVMPELGRAGVEPRLGRTGTVITASKNMDLITLPGPANRNPQCKYKFEMANEPAADKKPDK